jgi:hypothetical protein
MRLFPITLFSALLSLFASITLADNPLGFDMGWSPEQTEATLADLGVDGSHGTWLRVRGMVGSAVLSASQDRGLDPRVLKRREALAKLRERGHRLVALLRWSPGSWESGTRPGPAHLPLDLTEAYQRCRDLAYTYGDLIEAWEIDNEPDISFVPENAETFAAFYKACALGIIAGREAAEEYEGGKVKGEKSQSEDSDRLTVAGGTWLVSHDRAESAVMHSPLALPPGPYWQELVANDVLSYTEAFNYHYYGYPEDFRGVRDAWIAALHAAILPFSALSHPSSSALRPPLPLFITEYGYGLLDRFDRHTNEGRDRQKRFFELVLPHVTDGTITGAMAFVFMPWLGPFSDNEFGLILEMQSRQDADAARERADDSIEQSRPAGVTELVALEEIEKTKTDQSETPSEHPTSREGPKSPDLRRLISDDLSPVVLDFIAGENTQSVKRYNGHLLQQTVSAAEKVKGLKSKVAGQFGASSGTFSLVVYNFSDAPVTGKLSISIENGHVGALLINARPTPPEPTNSVKDPRPSTSGPSTQDAVSKPQPYIRPPTPRSSLRPITEPNWPNTDTPIVETEEGKTYAITPALELLRSAAKDFDEGHTWQTGDLSESTEAGVAYANATKRDRSADEHNKIGLNETGYSQQAAGADPSTNDPATPGLIDARPGFVSDPISLEPMERRELKFTATLPNEEFRGHRMSAVWKTSETEYQQVDSELYSIVPGDEELVESAPTLPAKAGTLAAARPLSNLSTAVRGQSLLTTKLYPSPSAFRMIPIDRFAFTVQDNADGRKRQLVRPRVEGKAQLFQHPTAERWLSTPGVDIEETSLGWRITVYDLPPESLRPAEIELPLPDGWTFPSDAALSFRYLLISSSPTLASSSEQHPTLSFSDSGLLDRDPSSSNRFEEFDVNFSDNGGTLWSVWPRLLARKATQSYLEPAGNFTPMFFSRATFGGSQSLKRKAISSQHEAVGSPFEARSVVIMIRPRVLPTTIEILIPQITELKPRG